MSDQSTNLQLPFLAQSQTQKHVTVNEALLRLDALVQLCAVSASVSTEPGAPSDGHVYILPPGKTGTHWGGMTNWSIAYYRDGVWEQITPRAGFIVFVNDTQLLCYYDGADWVQVEAANDPVPPIGDILCPHDKLRVVYVSATSVDVDADALILFDSGGNGKRFEAINLTLAITTSGADGLDTGAEAASTWYHIWVIGKSDGTLAGLLSASATAPTLPSGYPYKGYVGAVRNDGSSNFVKFNQRGRIVRGVFVIIQSGLSATSYTSVDVSAFVPPTASGILLTPGIYVSTGANAVNGYLSSGGSGTTPTSDEAVISNAVTTVPTFMPMQSVPVSASTIYYRLSGANARINIHYSGFQY